jgi:hypothetical protein
MSQHSFQQVPETLNMGLDDMLPVVQVKEDALQVCRVVALVVLA